MDPTFCVPSVNNHIVLRYILPLSGANIELSPVWDTSCLAELIYELINRQFLCGKCPKPVTIEYLPPGLQSLA